MFILSDMVGIAHGFLTCERTLGSLLRCPDSLTAAVLLCLAIAAYVVVCCFTCFCILGCLLCCADMLSYPGSTHLVITHKSLLRSMLCTAMGLPPRQFRAIDLSNGAVCMVR